MNDAERVQAWEAFQHLLDCGPARVTVPVALQVLAGPLVGYGVDSPPPLVHVQGETGSAKTGLCREAISIFGQFEGEGMLIPWTSTYASAQDYVYRARQLTLVFDDFKSARLKMSKSDFVNFIQNYADRTGRRRANQSGHVQMGKVARAIILSNGEDVWEADSSVYARTIVVRLKKDEIDKGKDSELVKLTTAAREGRLQLFGGDYLRWLMGQHNILEGEEFAGYRQRCLDLINANDTKDDTHPRLKSSLANLLAVGVVIQRVFPVATDFQGNVFDVRVFVRDSPEPGTRCFTGPLPQGGSNIVNASARCACHLH